MFLLKIMGIQLNTLELRWARPCSERVLSRTNLAYTVASFKEMEEDLKSPCANFLFCVLTSRYSFIMMRHNDYHRNKELKSSHDLSFVFTYCILGRQPLRPVSRSGALG